MSRTKLVRRAQEYSDRNGLVIEKPLGFGVHGIVFAVENQGKGGLSAIKVHERQPDYRGERDVYLLLQEHEVRQIRSCVVPQLVGYDDESWVIEMTMVRRPFVLDFAGAFLDHGPDFSEEVLADWRADKQEQFGARWPEVQAILGFLEGFGIFLVDVNPNNISFGD